jgi:hypothetical protein
MAHSVHRVDPLYIMYQKSRIILKLMEEFTERKALLEGLLQNVFNTNEIV